MTAELCQYLLGSLLIPRSYRRNTTRRSNSTFLVFKTFSKRRGLHIKRSPFFEFSSFQESVRPHASDVAINSPWESTQLRRKESVGLRPAITFMSLEK